MTRPLNINRKTQFSIDKISRTGNNSPKNARGEPQLRFNTFRYSRRVGDVLAMSHHVLDGVATPVANWYETNAQNPGLYQGVGVDPFVLNYSASIPDWSLDYDLRSKIASTDFQGLVTALEMKSTITGIGDRARRLGNAFMRLKRGDVRGFARALDITPTKPSLRKKPEQVRANVSGHMLEYQFGILPVYQDMYNAAVTVYEYSNWKPYKWVKVSGKRDLVLDTSTTLYVGGVSTPYTRTGSSRSLSVRVKGDAVRVKKMFAKVEVTNPELLAPSMFGMTNPIAAVYAAAPLSWIADQVYPIGGFLEQLYMPPGIGIADCGVVDVYKRKVHWANHISEYKTRYATHTGGWIDFPLKTQRCVDEVPSGECEDVTINMRPVSFPGISMPGFKLPFLGQVITDLFFLDTVSRGMSAKKR